MIVKIEYTIDITIVIIFLYKLKEDIKCVKYFV